MTLRCIRCGRPTQVSGIEQQPCPPPCGGTVFISTSRELAFTKDDRAWLKSIKIRPDDDPT